MKRQRSRNRGGGGGGSGGGGGGKPQHNVNRAFDSNGPDGVKIRGHAQHVFEKYQQLARDAGASGDRVLAENYLQHAEHYFRVLRAVQPQRPAAEILGRDAFTSGIDIDFEDESAPDTEAEASEQQDDGGESQRQDQRPDNNGRQDYRSDNRGEYRNNDRRPEYRRDEYRSDRDNRSDGRQDAPRQEGPRQEGPRQEGQRQDAPRQDNRQDARPDTRQDSRQEPRQDNRQDRFEGQRDGSRNYNRDDRGRGGYRDDRPRFEGRGERNGEPAQSDPLAVVEPEATPLTSERRDDDSPTLRSQDGGFSPAPAFLQTRTEAPADSGDAPAEPRKRRGRPPRRFEANNADTPATAEES